MSGFLAAVGLLTRIPVRTGSEPDAFTGAAPWFPMVGSLVALVVAGVYALGYRLMPSLLAALLAVVVGIVTTGGFHEDGLADTSDAVGSGTQGEQALRIMGDPRVGAFGSLALAVSVLGRMAALGSMGPGPALAALFAAHSLSRAAPVVLMATTPAARAEGLGHSGVIAVNAWGSWLAVIGATFIAALAVGWWVVPAIVGVAAGALWVRRWGTKSIGGVTGDLLGACQQIAEVTVLVVVAVAVWNGGRPWWM